MKELLEQESLLFNKSNKSLTAKLSDDLINDKYVKGEVRIITEQARYPLNTILTIVDNPSYILNPEFQRRHRWSNSKKSRLIESFIMNVPIPPVFLYEISYSVYEVMDGLQRLTAISQFYKDEFALETLEEWSELNGKKYSELPEQIKKGIDRRYLSSIILLQETAKTEIEAQRLKQMVFERINSGGELLTPQETRNALYPGPLNSLCIRLARNHKFCEMWGIPQPDQDEIENGIFNADLIKNPFFSKMQDVELVLRFFAYRQLEKWETPSLETFLDEFLKNGNMFDESIFEFYEKNFNDTIELIYNIFGEDAFYMWRTRQTNWILYERPTKVLYDPIMYVLSDMLVHSEKLIASKFAIINAVKTLHSERVDILGGRNTNRNDVLKRIEVLREFFSQFIDNA